MKIYEMILSLVLNIQNNTKVWYVSGFGSRFSGKAESHGPQLGKNPTTSIESRKQFKLIRTKNIIVFMSVLYSLHDHFKDLINYIIQLSFLFLLREIIFHNLNACSTAIILG